MVSGHFCTCLHYLLEFRFGLVLLHGPLPGLTTLVQTNKPINPQ